MRLNRFFRLPQPASTAGNKGGQHMTLPVHAERWLHRLVDRLSDVRPCPVPREDLLAGCRIVSHRGEHDNRGVIENTLPAFEAASRAGVWGIEFDIRWTLDYHPMVFHDADLKRIFGCGDALRGHTCKNLGKRFPLIPRLEEVVSRYGKTRHLMIELKKDAGLDPKRWSPVLKDALAFLEPGRDYHLMSLSPEIFSTVEWAPEYAFLPIGRVNLRACSQLALEQGYGGVTGHYQMLSRRMIAAHRRRGQKVGTGFPASRNVLFREIRRGVDWIFSDRAAQLQAICASYRSSASSRPLRSSTK